MGTLHVPLNLLVMSLTMFHLQTLFVTVREALSNGTLL